MQQLPILQQNPRKPRRKLPKIKAFLQTLPPTPRPHRRVKKHYELSNLLLFFI